MFLKACRRFDLFLFVVWFLQMEANDFTRIKTQFIAITNTRLPDTVILLLLTPCSFAKLLLVPSTQN